MQLIFMTYSLQPCPYWSPWTEFGSCTITCGGGEKVQTRMCINGEPGEIGCDEGGVDNTEKCNTQV